MVGVPGRSKGCITCRRRKKGCDLQRPICGQCRSKGLFCGSYNDDRIFVNENSRFSQGQGSIQHLQRVATQVDIMLPDNLTRSAYGERFIEEFFDVYLPYPHKGRPAVIHTNSFLSALTTLYVQDQTLRYALLAIGATFLGKVSGEIQLIQQGYRVYGQCLWKLQRALQFPDSSIGEALLAVPRLMGLFEILFGTEEHTKQQAASWCSHADGEWALMRNKGAESYSNGVAHDLFVEGRLNPIIAAIRMRKATPLNSDEWKTIPWKLHPKTPKDSLIDILAGIPELMHDREILPTLGSNVYANGHGKSLKKCLKLSKKLEYWSLRYMDLLYTPASEKAVAIHFRDPNTAHLSVLYWTTSTLLYLCLDDLLSVPFSDKSLHHQDRNHPRVFARRIARSASYFFGESLGIWGATTISFPIGTALLYLKRNEIDEDYTRLIFTAWQNPNLPGAIKKFIDSMGRIQITE
ncbi:hypothetical protein BS50DRAFT_26197 [Corynespora cassiicola Philippines]|uniref:Zn(2)-C6 fungal-type domain-containing protein n=1 Tax=Corynespora cassiicola Philippines TaxID=1448308 RepID=A0A2T2PB71_CORCC|nr:hypothetical protein BS50DRAFT_26197 [Corynespora cassiicola Philippines]